MSCLGVSPCLSEQWAESQCPSLISLPLNLGSLKKPNRAHQGGLEIEHLASIWLSPKCPLANWECTGACTCFWMAPQTSAAPFEYLGPEPELGRQALVGSIWPRHPCSGHERLAFPKAWESCSPRGLVPLPEKGTAHPCPISVPEQQLGQLGDHRQHWEFLDLGVHVGCLESSGTDSH